MQSDHTSCPVSEISSNLAKRAWNLANSQWKGTEDFGSKVWLSGCKSWYKNDKGVNFTLWPNLCVDYSLALATTWQTTSWRGNKWCCALYDRVDYIQMYVVRKFCVILLTLDCLWSWHNKHPVLVIIACVFRGPSFAFRISLIMFGARSSLGSRNRAGAWTKPRASARSTAGSKWKEESGRDLKKKWA